MTTNYLSMQKNCYKRKSSRSFQQARLEWCDLVNAWSPYCDQAESTQHRDQLNSLYTGYILVLYDIRIISKHINCLAAVGDELRFVNKVSITLLFSLYWEL